MDDGQHKLECTLCKLMEIAEYRQDPATMVCRDCQIKALRESNRKLHRRAQRAEANYNWARKVVPWEKVEKWNSELYAKLRHEASLEKARADAAEALLELHLAEKG